MQSSRGIGPSERVCVKCDRNYQIPKPLTKHRALYVTVRPNPGIRLKMKLGIPLLP
jgi:hypothetical protein